MPMLRVFSRGICLGMLISVYSRFWSRKKALPGPNPRKVASGSAALCGRGLHPSVKGLRGDPKAVGDSSRGIAAFRARFRRSGAVGPVVLGLGIAAALAAGPGGGHDAVRRSTSMTASCTDLADPDQADACETTGRRAALLRAASRGGPDRGRWPSAPGWAARARPASRLSGRRSWCWRSRWSSTCRIPTKTGEVGIQLHVRTTP